MSDVPPPVYVPPPQGNPQGYPQGYPPPPHYAYPPPQQQQQSVVVVNTAVAQPTTNTVIVQRQGVNHCLHFVITIFFFPWIIVWILLCILDAVC